MPNQPDIVLSDKQQKKAVVIDVAIPSNSNIRKKEHEKLEARGELGSEGNSDSSSDRSTGGCDPQTGSRFSRS